MSLFNAMFNRDTAAPRNYTRRIGDWSTSAPHLLLLSRFLTPQAPTPLAEEWQAALGEPSKDAIERYIALGLLLPAALPGQADRLICSAEARVLAEKYLARQQEEKDAALAESLAHLRAGDFEQASLTVARYEAGQVFPRESAIPWSRHEPAADVRRLAALGANRPAALGNLSEAQWAALHVAAGMLVLWGDGDIRAWLPADVEAVRDIDTDAAMRLLLSA